jgi:hypothetical protein
MPVYSASLREVIKREVNDTADYEHPLKGFKVPFPSSSMHRLSATVTCACPTRCRRIGCQQLPLARHWMVALATICEPGWSSYYMCVLLAVWHLRGIRVAGQCCLPCHSMQAALLCWPHFLHHLLLPLPYCPNDGC